MKRVLKWIAILITAVVILGTVGLAVIPHMNMHDMVDGHVNFGEMWSASEYGMEATELALVTEDGLKLAAWQVDAPDPRATVIFVSGIMNPSVTAFFGHAAALRREGFSSVLVEMRAHGGSEGDMICLGTKEYMDVQAAVHHIKEQMPDRKIIVFGLSMGAGVAVNAIGETPEIDGLVTLSAFSTWPDVFCDNMRLMGFPEPLCVIEKPFVWAYMGFKYGFDRLRINPMAEIVKLNGRPALLMQSRGDTQVPYANFEKLTAAAPQVETFVRDGDYHLICDDSFLHPEQDAEYWDAMMAFLDEHFD